MLPRRIVRFIGLFAALASVAADPVFFRSDFGLPPHPGTITSNLESGLIWRTELPSGHSSPILVNGRIYLTASRVDRRELGTFEVDPGSGAVSWKALLTVPRIEEYHPEEGNGAMATPASDGERLFVFFGSYGLLCYDLKTKQQLWEHRFTGFRDEYGAASSPVLLDGKVILNEDHDVDSFLIALDAGTGRVLWKTPRPQAVRSYATPAVWTNEGRRELLVAGALELAGYNPDNGEKLWWVNGLARIVIPTPLPVRDTIYMASWAPGGDPGQRLTLQKWDQALAKWDSNKDGRLAKDEVQDREVLSRFFRMDLNQDGLLDGQEWGRHAEVFRKAQNSLLAIQPRGRGDLTESAVKWKYERGAPYVASPLFDQGIVWMVKDGGLVTKVEAATGKLLQQERVGATGNYYASPVAADGKVFVASESGVVTILGDEREWKILSTHPFHEKIYATPLIDSGRVYIRTEKALYCFGTASGAH